VASTRWRHTAEGCLHRLATHAAHFETIQFAPGVHRIASSCAVSSNIFSIDVHHLNRRTSDETTMEKRTRRKIVGQIWSRDGVDRDPCLTLPPLRLSFSAQSACSLPSSIVRSSPRSHTGNDMDREKRTNVKGERERKGMQFGVSSKHIHGELSADNMALGLYSRARARTHALSSHEHCQLQS
jgi:hypothetical protein